MTTAIVVLTCVGGYLAGGVAGVAFRGHVEPQIVLREGRDPERQHSFGYPDVLVFWFFFWWVAATAYGLRVLAEVFDRRSTERLRSRKELERELEAAQAEVNRLLGRPYLAGYVRDK